jgi:DNA-binding Lrp family transcriptional regulator
MVTVQDVKQVRGTYGIHDIVVKVKSKDSEVMNKIITNTIRRLPGITSTNTLIAIEEQGGKEYTDAVDLHGS